MIDQRLLRTDLDAVKAAMSRRSAELVGEVERAASLDGDLVRIGQLRDSRRADANALQEQLSERHRRVDGGGAGDELSDDERQCLIEEGQRAKTEARDLSTEYDGIAHELREILLRLPNVPHPDAPDGATDADNPVVVGPNGLLDEYPAHQRVPHWESGVELGILDNARAVKISGAMFTMQRGAGATLARALCQYGLDRNADAHEEIRPPSLVSTATLMATGQLPKFADDAYAIERDDLWASPTAEAPLTSMYAGEILDDTELPIRLMAHSSSYRREAGSAGRDTRGMLRAHEFDKVEMMAYSTPEGAPDLLDDMIGRAERAIADLGLPYRVIEICTGDMGQSHHRSFDVEVYAPGADTWLEVSSVSWFGDYQARRANVRFRRHDENGKAIKGSEFVHTLNGSALAVPRVWAAILENYRNADGSITVPDVLHPYMRGITSITPHGTGR